MKIFSKAWLVEHSMFAYAILVLVMLVGDSYTIVPDSAKNPYKMAQSNEYTIRQIEWMATQHF